MAVKMQREENCNTSDVSVGVIASCGTYSVLSLSPSIEGLRERTEYVPQL